MPGQPWAQMPRVESGCPVRPKRTGSQGHNGRCVESPPAWGSFHPDSTEFSNKLHSPGKAARVSKRPKEDRACAAWAAHSACSSDFVTGHIRERPGDEWSKASGRGAAGNAESQVPPRPPEPAPASQRWGAVPWELGPESAGMWAVWP